MQRELVEQIQMQNGQEAKLYFNPSKLVISDNINMGKVEKIIG